MPYTVAGSKMKKTGFAPVSCLIITAEVLHTVSVELQRGQQKKSVLVLNECGENELVNE